MNRSLAEKYFNMYINHLPETKKPSHKRILQHVKSNNERYIELCCFLSKNYTPTDLGDVERNFYKFCQYHYLTDRKAF